MPSELLWKVAAHLVLCSGSNGYAAGEKFSVPLLIALTERRPVLEGCPPAYGNVPFAAALSCESSQIQPISKSSVGELRPVGMFVSQHECCPSAQGGQQSESKKCFHCFLDLSLNQVRLTKC